jgi:hypothetical protein
MVRPNLLGESGECHAHYCCNVSRSPHRRRRKGDTGMETYIGSEPVGHTSWCRGVVVVWVIALATVVLAIVPVDVAALV